MGDEAADIYDYIISGGNVIIACDNGNLNAISRSFGIETYGHRVYSENYDKNISFLKGEGSVLIYLLRWIP